MVESQDKQIVDILSTVFDPEVPVLNIVEMGIVRGAEIDDSGVVHVALVPTYTGCPAMNAIEVLARKVIREAGYDRCEVHTLYHEVWTTDWMTDEAREKLREYGIAPPRYSGEKSAEPACPYCGSVDTTLTSRFGSTACKSLHFCNGCVQPFEHFKCH
ncbi:MAG: phenylacetate-CoA oxygenase subunit PaaJ [Rhodothermales bacterium]|nr:phenylacetate-CoA oxygenase subunit PaaJ [Rhodothermales bacterium]